MAEGNHQHKTNDTSLAAFMAFKGCIVTRIEQDPQDMSVYFTLDMKGKDPEALESEWHSSEMFWFESIRKKLAERVRKAKKISPG